MFHVSRQTLLLFVLQLIIAIKSEHVLNLFFADDAAKNFFDFGKIGSRSRATAAKTDFAVVDADAIAAASGDRAKTRPAVFEVALIAILAAFEADGLVGKREGLAPINIEQALIKLIMNTRAAGDNIIYLDNIS